MFLDLFEDEYQQFQVSPFSGYRGLHLKSSGLVPEELAEGDDAVDGAAHAPPALRHPLQRRRLRQAATVRIPGRDSTGPAFPVPRVNLERE